MNVCALLVTYCPCKDKIQHIFTSITAQVKHILVVDNTPDEIWDITSNCNKHQYTMLKNNGNIGLSKAQNIGIQWAIEHGYDDVLILDQDSVPAADMVDKLVEASQLLKQRGVKLAAVGPRYGRAEAPTSSFLRFGKYRYEYYTCDTEPWVECSFLISSGMLIPVDAFSHIGLMDESLFIDHIDTEWCLRAKSMGYVCYGVCDAYMSHELGERVVSVWWGRERNISLHHAFRLYYIFRNSVLLYKRPYMPMRWKVFDLKRLIFFPMLYLLYSNEKWKSLKYMMLGIWHGWLGRGGKLND